MAGVKGKFTDNNLKHFLGHLLKHYQDCINRENPPSLHEVYTELFQATQYAIESPNGSLYYLDKFEKNKVYAYFEAIFRATPIYTSLSIHDQRAFIPNRKQFSDMEPYVLAELNNYTCANEMNMNWHFLIEVAYHCHQRVLDLNKKSITSKASEESEVDGPGWMIVLTILGLVAIGPVLLFVSLYYMFHQFLNSTERLFYGEGWIKAALMMATSLGFGGAAAGLTLGYATPILTSLAISAGLNPIIVIIIATSCVTVIGAGLACMGMSLLYDFIEKRVNTSAMDPADPYRFRLTQQDEQRLYERHLDPVKVKCAMIALRSQMAKELGTNDEVPSFLNRHFGEGARVHNILSQVRELRAGNLSVINVGDLSFDCRLPVVTVFNSLKRHYEPLAYSDNTHLNLFEDSDFGSSELNLNL